MKEIRFCIQCEKYNLKEESEEVVLTENLNPADRKYRWMCKKCLKALEIK